MTESTRKLSNLQIQWTKTLYQNNFKYIAFFLHFQGLKIFGARENERQISQNYALQIKV